MVKKEKARLVEDSLIKAATTGQLKSKVTDAQLITMLEQMNPADTEGTGGAGGGKKKAIIIQRRKYGMDDDDVDDNDDDL